MANGVNKVIIVGNLGRDPEVRYTNNGKAVCNLRVAATERTKKGDEWVDHTEWVNVVVFGRSAENCGQYLAKGRQVYVEGKLREKKWQDKDGIDRWSTEVVSFQVLFLSGSHEEPTGDRNRRRASKQPADGAHDDGFSDEDLPF